MTSQPGLTAKGGPQDNQFYPLPETEFIIGRTEPCSLQITWDPSISRRHARIYQQSGLFWLEDLGSTNGTFIAAFQDEERQLKHNESVLLLDGAMIRLGKHVLFSITGLTVSQDEAMQLLTARLQHVLANLYAGMAHLPPEDRESQLEWLRDFENRLRNAQSEQEILMIASEGAQTLFGTVQMELPQQNDLPPMPEDIPDPALANQVKSILNFFYSDIRNRFPKEDEQDG